MPALCVFAYLYQEFLCQCTWGLHIWFPYGIPQRFCHHNLQTRSFKAKFPACSWNFASGPPKRSTSISAAFDCSVLIAPVLKGTRTTVCLLGSDIQKKGRRRRYLTTMLCKWGSRALAELFCSRCAPAAPGLWMHRTACKYLKLHRFPPPTAQSGDFTPHAPCAFWHTGIQTLRGRLTPADISPPTFQLPPRFSLPSGSLRKLWAILFSNLREESCPPPGPNRAAISNCSFQKSIYCFQRFKRAGGSSFCYSLGFGAVRHRS